MQMEVAKEKLEGNKVKLKVELETERANNALEQAYRKVVKKMIIPGFRKGKAPRRILEARYGKEILHKDALNILVDTVYNQIVQAAEIEPVSRLELEDYYLIENEPANFTAVVEVKPEVELGEYTNLGIKKEDLDVTEDLEKYLERLREEHSQLENSGKEVAENGDFAILDYTGYINDKLFSGGSVEEFSLEVGSGSSFPGFEDELIGKKVGEEFRVKITLPGDYHTAELAGQEALFEVIIKEIKVKKTPELNDDFAREVSDFNTMDEFKEGIKKELEKQKGEVFQYEFENKLIKKIVENASVEISEALINNQLDIMYHNMAFDLARQGIKIEDYLERLGIDEKTWRENNHDNASKIVRDRLVLEAIAKKEGIEVSDEELDSRIAELATKKEQKPEQVKDVIKKQGQLEEMRYSFLIRKIMDFLIDNN